MSRRYLIFLIGINAIISLAIALLVTWLVELRRPDPEELASLITIAPPVNEVATPILAVTPVLQVIETATTAPAPTQSAPQQTGPIYVVQSGDSLSSIATRFNTSMNALLEANNLDNPDFVFVGQRLILPDGAEAPPAQSANGSTPTVAESSIADNVAGGQQSAATGVKIALVDGQGTIETESIQIVNESDLALNLQGWTVGFEGGPIYTFRSFPIFPGGSVRLFTKTGTDTTVNLFWGREATVLQPGVAIRLVNSQGQLANQFTVP